MADFTKSAINHYFCYKFQNAFPIDFQKKIHNKIAILFKIS